MKATVILPLYNGRTTIGVVLESFANQPKIYERLIIIDDGSTDGSANLVKKYLGRKKMPFTIISHARPRGLAASYNEAIRKCRTELIVTMHQDVILGHGALRAIIDPFLKPDAKNVVGTYHIVSHPFWVWKKYNFWQKCYFARFVGKSYVVAGGKFNCYRRRALVRAGLYDEKKYKTAGEDTDMIYKLKKIGLLARTKARIIHLHKIDPHFGWRDIVYKHAQYAESRGALLRNGRVESVSNLLEAFYRELLVLMLLVPPFSLVSVVLIIANAYLYTGIMYEREAKDSRIFMLPILNTALLFVSAVFCVRGYLTKKQTI